MSYYSVPAGRVLVPGIPPGYGQLVPELPPKTPTAPAGPFQPPWTPTFAIATGGMVAAAGYAAEKPWLMILGGVLLGVGLGTFPFVEAGKAAIGLKGLGDYGH